MIHRFTKTRFTCALLALVISSLILGCSSFSRSTKTKERNYSPLAPLRMSSDIVALEIAVVSLDAEALQDFDAVWSKADLQSLPIEVRKNLDRNGFRSALLGSQLPGELTAALNWSQPLMTSEGDILFSSHEPLPPNHSQGPYLIRQIEQLNAGDQHWIPCTNPLAQLNWKIESGESRRSGFCRNALCGWTISQVPTGDGSVKLWFQPEIRHGDRKWRYGIDQETLLVQEKQELLTLDELNFGQRLRLGQTLVLTCHETPIGLGEQYFASGRFSSTRQALLIRLVQTGHDDLFAPEQTSRSLSTSLD
ncbi:MAG: hypothetical protein P8J91_08360 [Pirellulaceae bacterium]|nr:hypothetical protein [Pirellulaceae bacterium]MDG2103749.1 hypothetical protein [Pirellulaceae bacterium]